MALLALVAGCGWIGPSDLQAVMDRDGDGLDAEAYATGPRGDCDDDDPDRTASEKVEWFRDVDGDGVGAGRVHWGCAARDGFARVAGDCDDANPSAFPGNVEVCDGVDNDCDGPIDEDFPILTRYRDTDGDGDGGRGPEDIAVGRCVAAPGWVVSGTDCDDGDANVHLGAPERCNGIDDDCVGGVDDGLSFVAYYLDADVDGFGNPTGGVVNACAPVPGRVANHDDCDDTDDTIRPGVPEVCNGIDDDCVGGVDDGLTFADYYLDTDVDGFGNPTGGVINACAPVPGRVANYGDCDDTDDTVYPGAEELCDGQLNACLGQPLATELDTDRDGFVACDATGNVWAGASALTATGPGQLDCAPTDPLGFPGAVERCDGVDNDCDTHADNNLAFIHYFPDADRDGYGTGEPISSCSDPGFGYALFSGDCDEEHASVHPNAPEACDGVDTDCVDGPSSAELDGDHDLHVTCDRGPLAWLGDPAIHPGTDCDDADDDAWPGNVEVCDGVDNDCLRGPDDGLQFRVYFADLDGDGYGDPSSQGVSSCSPVEGRALSFDDCDDMDGQRHPGADELCYDAQGNVDPVDSDCDGDYLDDHADDAFSYYLDRDGDTYGDRDGVIKKCQLIPPPGYVRKKSPCNEIDGDCFDCNDDPAPADGPLQRPGLPEICNGLDSNCDGLLDNNPILAAPGGQLWYLDSDHDGYGDPARRACTQLADHVAQALDCNDTDDQVHPGVPDIVDGKDNDCDGNIDGSGFGTSIVIQGDPITTGGFGHRMSKAANGRLLVSAVNEGGNVGAVYLFEPPFTGGIAPERAVTVFKGRAGTGLQLRGEKNGVDLTNDGVEDYVLFEGSGYGTVLIVPGPVPPGIVDPYEITSGPQRTIRIAGTATNPLLYVMPVESVTADPYADLVVSTTFGPNSYTSACSGGFFRGSVQIFDGPILEDRTIDDAWAHLNGHDSYAGLQALGAPGDLDGDGDLDLAFGSPKSDDYYGILSRCYAGGRVQVVLGPVDPGAMVVSVTLLGARSVINGAELGGTAVDASHYLDSDNQADLLVGAPFSTYDVNTNGHDTKGRIYVIAGSRLFPPGGTPVTSASFSSVAASVYTDVDRSYFGRQFDLDDIDRDGAIDLLVARPGAKGAYLFRGPLLNPGTKALSAATRYWIHPTSALEVSLLLPDGAGGPMGEAVHGESSSSAAVGEVYIFPGEAFFVTP